MSLHYRSGSTEGERKTNPSVKLTNELSRVYQQKLNDYDLLHKELTNAKDISLHDSHLSNQTDDKLVELSILRDELIGLSSKLEVLALV